MDSQDKSSEFSGLSRNISTCGQESAVEPGSEPPTLGFVDFCYNLQIYKSTSTFLCAAVPLVLQVIGSLQS